jgi:hypothetical protein
MPFTYTTISSTETIGDSLSSVNKNYLNFDVWTQNIAMSADVIWNPLIDFFNYYKENWTKALTITRDNSAKWIDLRTNVQTNSAAWIEPITIFYPDFFPDPFTPNNLVTVQQFLQNTFPIYSSRGNYPGVYGTRMNLPPGSIVTADYIDTDQDRIDDRYQLYPGAPANNKNIPAFNAKPNYIENQTAIIYSYTYIVNSNAINSTTLLKDSTTCTTNPRTVCISCTNTYSGGGPCNSGYFTCNGLSNSCSQCKDVKCFYSGAPYESINSATAKSSIEANVSMIFSERAESANIVAAVFKVANCEWTFERFITT